MAVMRDRPYGSSNFLVDFGGGDSRAVTAGFAEVIFPPFDVDAANQPQAESMANQGAESIGAAAGNHLILKRGLIGTLDLYGWWDKTRQGQGPQGRTVKIELLSEDQTTVVLTWHFRNVRPVSLSYSPLRAVEGGMVMETVELAFDSMEMS